MVVLKSIKILGDFTWNDLTYTWWKKWQLPYFVLFMSTQILQYTTVQMFNFLEFGNKKNGELFHHYFACNETNFDKQKPRFSKLNNLGDTISSLTAKCIFSQISQDG